MCLGFLKLFILDSSVALMKEALSKESDGKKALSKESEKVNSVSSWQPASLSPPLIPFKGIWTLTSSKNVQKCKKPLFDHRIIKIRKIILSHYFGLAKNTQFIQECVSI